VVDAGDNPEVAGIPQLTLSPSALQFESRADVAPVTRSTLVSNTGSAPAQLSGLASNANFTVGHDCPASLAVDATCLISVTPTAPAPGVVQYQMTVLVPGAATQAALSLSTFERSLTAPSPRLQLTREMVPMGPLAPGESATASTELTNTGNAPALLGGLSSGRGFTVTDDCPDELAAGASCAIAASFSSYDAKTHNYTLALTSGTGAGAALTFYAEVKGDPAILPALELDTGTLAFGPLDAGTADTKKVVLRNRGTAPAMLASFNANAPFSLTSACPAQLAVGATCDIFVTFNAFTQGTSPAQQITIAAQDGVNTRLLLQGQVKSADSTAPTLVLAPADLAFNSVAVGQSLTREVTVTNTGVSAAAVSGVAVDYGTDVFAQTHDCPASLAPGATCRISVTFSAKAAETRSGRVQVSLTNGASGTLPLSGTGQAALLNAGPTTLDFGTLNLPGTTDIRSVSLSNSGNVPLTGLEVVNSNNRLSIAYGTCTQTLEAKKGCVLSVAYAPGAAGSFADTFEVRSANGGKATVSWSGTAIKLAATPSTLSFATTRVGSSASDQVVTLTNQGSSQVQLGALGVLAGAGHFGQSNNCGGALAAGASCAIAVRYSPANPGTHTGEIGITVQGLPVARIALAGTGVAPTLNLSATSLQFAPTNVGQSSAVQGFTVTNATDQAAAFSGMGLSAGGTEFSQSNNCGSGLAAGTSCLVNIQMTPLSKNGSSGTWTMVSTFGTQSVALSGQGTEPVGSIEGETSSPPPPPPPAGSPAPVSDGYTHYAISFLNTEVNTSSAVRNVKFRNQGDGPLAVLGVSVASGATDFAQSNNCGGTLAPGAYCTISMLFTPSALGVRSGGIALVSDGGQFFFDLSGSGIGAVGSWRADSTADFGFVGVGTTATRSFTFSNTGTIAAKQVMTELVGANLRFTSNTCGAPGSPVAVPTGGTCRATVEYAPTSIGPLEGGMLQSSGTLANGPVRLALAGSAPAPALTFDADPTGSFGTVTAGSPVSRTYYLRNTGQVTDTVASLNMQGSGFTLTGGTCQAGLAMPVNSVCSATVTAAATTAGPQAGTLQAASTQGASIARALSAQVIQSEYAISGVHNSNTSPNADFGTRTVNGDVLVRTYYLRDTTNIATVSAQTLTLDGDGSFQINRVGRIAANGSWVSTCTSTATSISAPCAAPGAGYSIAVEVKFVAVSVGAKAATLRFGHNGAGGTSELALSGVGQFNPTAVWSSAPASLVVPTAAALSYGTRTTGTTLDKVLYIRNTGTNGAQAVGFTLSGDTSQFKIIAVYKARRDSLDYTYTCGAGGVIASGGLSATPCLTEDPASSTYAYSGVYVAVRYTPTAVGEHSVTITPTSNNGTVVPGALSLTGSAAFNPVAAWSSAPASLVAPTAAALSYGTRTMATTLDKVLYIRNTGTNGAQAVGFTLSGDTSQFKIIAVYKARRDSLDYTYTCGAGGVIASGGLSATPCLTEDPASSTYAYSGVYVAVRYTPTAVGEHSVTITPTSNNGTVVPGALSLTGSAAFNPVAAWSSAPASLVAPTAAALSYGTRTTGTTLDKVLYLRNTGTNGAQAVGFTLSGDTSQFKIISVYKARRDSLDTVYGCSTGGAIAGGGMSATPCLAEDPASASYAYSGVYVAVRYTPTVVGDHSVTITPTTNNGTVVPGALSLTGSGAFNPVAAWSSSATALVAPTTAALSYGSRATGTNMDKVLYVRNTGANGAQAVGFTLSGDTSQFKLVTVYKTYQRYDGYNSTCTGTSGKIATGGASATPCLTEDVAAAGNPYSGVYLVLRYTPTAAGSYSVTVTPTTDNGTVLPGALTLTGSAP
jgi:hypothetical protein